YLLPVKGLTGFPVGQGFGLLRSNVELCPLEGQAPAVFAGTLDVGGGRSNGDSRYARFRPLCTPQPTICPESFMARAVTRTDQPAAVTSGRALRSVIPESLDHMNARASVGKLLKLVPTT